MRFLLFRDNNAKPYSVVENRNPSASRWDCGEPTTTRFARRRGFTFRNGVAEAGGN